MLLRSLRVFTSVIWVGIFTTLLTACVWLIGADVTLAESGTDFPGTVLSADAAASKLAVKKEGSGTRFTFVVNEKTQFSGGVKGLADLKKGDSVNVTYSVVGSQYIAQKVMKGK